MARADSTLQFFRRAFEILKAESPDRYAALCVSLEAAPGRYQVGTERFTLTAARSRISVAPGWRAKTTKVEAAITPRDILDLVDGTATLLRLLAGGTVTIKGNAETLLILSEAVHLFIDGAVTSRALQNHFEHYRTWVLHGVGSLKRSSSART
ncbi:MAG: hypothetical protein HYY65_11870 [Candidatus Tectomicrobia bacterium]|uniref:SCP2 domain-containing protein n=1 Tax=Tectimicrobiota bacterium TaxID=2528274 RepID=A0A932GRL9_UNCTE|nr:hypothetical protein [Candidatus Tectomicrobia bacterium]